MTHIYEESYGGFSYAGSFHRKCLAPSFAGPLAVAQS